MLLEVQGVSKSFGTETLWKQLSFAMEEHEVVALMGRSGAGKTTLLRCIAGLDTLDQGVIFVDDQKLSYGAKTGLQNKVGMVFQSYQLFPHMTVLENIIEAPIYHKQMTKEQAILKARELLATLQIAEKQNSYPAQLSGGQMQRVAIARACILNPRLLCLDEPTAALDTESTTEVASMIQDLAKTQMGILIVSHDVPFVEQLQARTIWI